MSPSSATPKGGLSSQREGGGGLGTCGPAAARSSALPPPLVAAPSARSWSCAVIRLPKLLIPCPDSLEAHAESPCQQAAGAVHEEAEEPPKPIMPRHAGGTKGVYQRLSLDYKVSAGVEEEDVPCDSWKEGEYKSEDEADSSREYRYTEESEEEADGDKKLNASLSLEQHSSGAHAMPLSHPCSATSPSSMPPRSFSANRAPEDTTSHREFRRTASVPSVRAAEHTGAWSSIHAAAAASFQSATDWNDNTLGVPSQRNIHRASSVSPRLLNSFSSAWEEDATAWEHAREHVMANWKSGKSSITKKAASKKQPSFQCERELPDSSEALSFAVQQGTEEREKDVSSERLSAVVLQAYNKPPQLVIGCDHMDEEDEVLFPSWVTPRGIHARKVDGGGRQGGSKSLKGVLKKSPSYRERRTKGKDLRVTYCERVTVVEVIYPDSP